MNVLKGSSVLKRVAESPVRFLREAPKIYEMCLHVLLDVEVGLRESKGWLGEGALGQWKPSPLLGSALFTGCRRKDVDEG
ncbi:hypothetical protein QQF64_017511 [Cirrhinus molitorella]|uniref:Uncharacterized protein n=1 Tax=Cirrhinus molitorella TaxID=172907 RepID=A0ABR3LIX8_9TELE